MATILRSGSWLNDNREIFSVYVETDLKDGSGKVTVAVDRVESLQQVNSDMVRLTMDSGRDHEITGTIAEFIALTMV